ncbi:VanZ family protein [Halalkalicoccus jeotgali]|uniref:VanZ-like domain-containing protein n=1 Tax=Halalkalicoccus jeotgali (strain DSM 18796 / CECT 7217 / JCM 14584 / KCTC 4019 / B3) TaxID=795797 RepID=D8J2X9_HALJB|nr:VanZ family protein [Halalkalicoccus jeotgali]ADJ15086.1 hypothetical protein HacjB3_08515 [Halalkalicoccus jeotgali B3]ELY34895.1 hypothetical protein C497_14187 [Halalkalicoccus jeotgali B3]
MIASVHKRWLTVAILAGTILVVSLIPIPGAVPEDGGIPPSVLFHFIGYAALAGAVGIALLVSSRTRAVAGASVGASAYGVLMECLQYPLSYRSFSYVDMAINTTGATLGALLVVCVLSRSDDHR